MDLADGEGQGGEEGEGDLMQGRAEEDEAGQSWHERAEPAGWEHDGDVGEGAGKRDDRVDDADDDGV